MFRFKNFFLTAAASQAKKDALVKKYKLDPQVVDKLADIDPTPNGEFTDWLCREASRTHLPGLRQLSEINTYLQEYIKLKRNPEWKGEKNVLNLSYDAFKTLIEAASREDYSKKQKVRDIEENAKKYIRDGVNYLGKVEGAYCYQILTPEASQVMSAGTHWCTQSESYSKSYLSDGRLYVFTKSGSQNSYGNDKYAQIYVSENRIEGELASGNDITSNNTWGLVFNDETLKFMEFLGQFDGLVKKGLEEGKIRVKSGAARECHECGGEIDEDDDDIRTDDDGNYYHTDCYYDRYSSCENCGNEIDRENDYYAYTDDGFFCSDCSRHCPHCDESYRTAGRGATDFYDVNLEGRELAVCESCFMHDFYSCASCGEGFEQGTNMEFNGDEVCPSCFAKEWDEDTGSIIDAWVESEGLGDTIKAEVIAYAEKRFQEIKLAVVYPYYEKMKKEGYLYDWNDVDLATALEFVPPGQEQALEALRKMVKAPLDYILEKLPEAIREDAHPNEKWDASEIVSWLEDNGIIEDDQYQNNLVELLVD